MAGLEGFTPLTIDLDGDNAWTDLGPDDFTGGMATHVAVLPNGTSGGKPSIAIRGRLDDGSTVVLETTWNLLYTAARAIEARYGGAREVGPEGNVGRALDPTAASGCELIAVERQRQIDAEGWTPEHDDGHTLGEMAAAGACYALLGTRWKDSSVLGSRLVRNILWPWDDEWFKPTEYLGPPYTPDVHIDRHVRDLVKAGALIAAEIDRLQRSRRG